MTFIFVHGRWAYVWSVSMKDMNKLAHIMNGNTSAGVVITAAVLTGIITDALAPYNETYVGTSS